MADYKEKLDELHQAARRKVRELDEKFALKDLVEEGTRGATDAATGTGGFAAATNFLPSRSNSSQ